MFLRMFFNGGMTMKKFLTLCVILGLASAANAALQMNIEVGGVPYAGAVLDTGTTVDIILYDTVPDTAGSAGTMVFNVEAGSNFGYTNLTPIPTYGTPPGGMEGWAWTLDGNATTAGGPDGSGGYDFNINKAATAGTGTPGAGSLMDPILTTFYYGTMAYNFDVVSQADGDIVIASTTGAWNGVSGANATWTQTINVVPEPMTIALLGLGGLLLRRRK
jgi:hypothetical protein